jgi:hypothetical protein
VPRPPKKVKPGSGLVRITFMLDADMAHAIDEEADRLTTEDETGRGFNRTDALRVVIRDGLKARADKRGK